jgi:hypothetical protein
MNESLHIEVDTKSGGQLDKVNLELIRIPGIGRYRKPTVGIGRLENFRIVRLSKYQILESGARIQKSEWRAEMKSGILTICDNGMDGRIEETFGLRVSGAGNVRGVIFKVGIGGKVAVGGGYRQLTAVKNFMRAGGAYGVLSGSRAEGCTQRRRFGCNGLLDSDSRKPHFSCLAVRRDSAGPTNL